jgi:hypothetical protein
VAAAICSDAEVIVTFNLKHYPESAIARYGIEAQHPDEFLGYQLDLASNLVCVAAKRHRASLKKKPKTVEEYLATLEAQGLAQTVARLRKFSELI